MNAHAWLTLLAAIVCAVVFTGALDFLDRHGVHWTFASLGAAGAAVSAAACVLDAGGVL